MAQEAPIHEVRPTTQELKIPARFIPQPVLEPGHSYSSITDHISSIVLRRKMPTIWYNLAVNLANQKKTAQAEGAFRELLMVAPGFPEAHCNLGCLLRNQGRFAEALAHLKEGHRLGSRRPSA